MISVRQMNIVYRKELLDGIRDKRAIFTAIVIPLFSPLMIYFLFNAMIDLREDLKETELMIAGASNAPDLSSFRGLPVQHEPSHTFFRCRRPWKPSKFH